MSKIFVISTLFIAISKTNVVFTSTSYSQIECFKDSNIFWPDYTNHENFHICTSIRETKMMSCEIPQKFNFYEQKCVFASEWLKPPKPEDIFSLMELDESFKGKCNDDENARWPVVDNKSDYFQCVSRMLVVKCHCESSEFFDSKLQKCSPFSPSCRANEITLLWPDPSSMEHFFRCIAFSQSVREQCAEGLHFVFQIQMCTQITQTTPILQRAPNCTVDQLHFRWPDPAHDRNYFTCTNVGEYHLNSCLNGFIFEFSFQMCIPDPQATMTPEITPETTTQWGQTTRETTRDPYAELECNFDDLHLLWPVIGYVYDFYICMGLGQSVRRNCPQGMIFVFNIQMCTNDPRVQTTTVK